MKPYNFEDEDITAWGVKIDHLIYIQSLKSKNKGKGNATSFINNLLNENYSVKICMPISAAIDHICEKLGFKKVRDYHPYYSSVCEMWVKYREDK